MPAMRGKERYPVIGGPDRVHLEVVIGYSAVVHVVLRRITPVTSHSHAHPSAECRSGRSQHLLGLRHLIRHLDDSILRGPADSTELKEADAAGMAVGGINPRCFIGYRIAEIAVLPAESRPAVADRSMHLVGAGRWSPVD